MQECYVFIFTNYCIHKNEEMLIIQERHSDCMEIEVSCTQVSQNIVFLMQEINKNNILGESEVLMVFRSINHGKSKNFSLLYLV